MLQTRIVLNGWLQIFVHLDEDEEDDKYVEMVYYNQVMGNNVKQFQIFYEFLNSHKDVQAHVSLILVILVIQEDEVAEIHLHQLDHHKQVYLLSHKEGNWSLILLRTI